MQDKMTRHEIGKAIKDMVRGNIASEIIVDIEMGWEFGDVKRLEKGLRDMERLCTTIRNQMKDDLYNNATRR